MGIFALQGGEDVNPAIELNGPPPKSYDVELTVEDGNGNTDSDADRDNNP